MRVLVSAGEPSGRLFAELLSAELGRLEPGTRLCRLGPGHGVSPAVGFVEGLRAAPSERRRLRAVVRLLGREAADCVVLIGYSGFNVPLGINCRRLGIRVVYLAPPQTWAWAGSRVTALRRAADKVVCLFPFEVRPLVDAGVDAVFLGYPLLDCIQRAREWAGTTGDRGSGARHVVFLPGSRPQETRFHGPLFRRVFRRLRQHGHDLAGVLVRAPQGGQAGGLEHRYGVMQGAACAVVVSGTATLETALLGTPQVVCYHLSPASRVIARFVVRSRSFALPNILLGPGTVPELLEPTVGRLVSEVAAVLESPAAAQRAETAGDRLRQYLGPAGAMERTARLVLETGTRGRRLPRS